LTPLAETRSYLEYAILQFQKRYAEALFRRFHGSIELFRLNNKIVAQLFCYIF